MTRQARINKLKKEAKELKGVSVDITVLNSKRPNVFRAQLTRFGVTYSLGYHVTAVEAAKAYNKKAKSLFGSEKAAKEAGRWNNI